VFQQALVVTPGEVGDESGPRTLPGEFPLSDSSQENTVSKTVSFLSWMLSKNLSPKRVADVSGKTMSLPEGQKFYTYANWDGPPEDDTTFFFTDGRDLVVYYYSDASGYEFIKRILP